MPTTAPRTRNGDLPFLPKLTSARPHTRTVHARSRIARMDYHDYERRKSLREMLPAVAIAMVAAVLVALMCWSMR